MPAEASRRATRRTPKATTASEEPVPLGTGDLLELVLSTTSIESYLDELALLAGGVSAVIGGCGVSIRRESRMFSTAVSNALAGEADEIQYSLGDGPCLAAMETGTAVSVEDVATERRFGTYPGAVRDRGVRSSFSVPLVVGGITVGALNSYSREPHSFTRVLREELMALAARAEVAIALMVRAASHTDVTDQLHSAVASRSVLDQALGILMMTHRCDAEAALAHLQPLVRPDGRGVAAAASELIAEATEKTPRAGRSQRWAARSSW